MGSIAWGEVFPTKLSLIIFISYMTLCVNQGLIVTASQTKNNSYTYNTVTVVLFTEILKLIISVLFYCKDHSLVTLFKDSIKYSKVLLLYFVPAFLYCLYNNLSFTNLLTFDPTTYYLLLQLRVVITGILFQIIFKKKLSKKQWLSLCLLTVGCMLKQVNFTEQTEDTNTMNKNTKGFDFSISAVFIIIQTLCSCLAGVYNEYLLKGKGADVNIFVQNVFMYLDSILCNLVVLLFQGDLVDAFSSINMKAVFHFKVIIIMINNASVGIITSFFLKSMNSILKTFASALELVFTAVLSLVFFGIPVYLNTIISIAVVSYAVFLYTQNPVVNVKEADVEEKEVFLKDSDAV